MILSGLWPPVLWCLMLFEKMQTRITLQKMTETQDSASGELVEQVQQSSNVWAEVKSTKGGCLLKSNGGAQRFP